MMPLSYQITILQQTNHSFHIHWPTEPPLHPHTHPWVGVSLQIINLQTELNYLDEVKTY